MHFQRRAFLHDHLIGLIIEDIVLGCGFLVVDLYRLVRNGLVLVLEGVHAAQAFREGLDLADYLFVDPERHPLLYYVGRQVELF